MSESAATYKEIREASKLYNKTKREIESLMSEYRDYQKFFDPKDGTMAVSMAEDRFYSHMLNELDIYGYEESRYNLEHRSLETRMDENRVLRNALTAKLKNVKESIKRLSFIHAINRNEESAAMRQKRNDVMLEMESILQAEGIEILKIHANTVRHKKEYEKMIVYVTTEKYKMEASMTLSETLKESSCVLIRLKNYMIKSPITFQTLLNTVTGKELF
jgi:hypothetical protein